MEHDALVSRRKYLATNFRPDREYVDGHLVERNVAEREHGIIHSRLAGRLQALRDCGLAVAEERRLQVSHSRYRVPDVCLVEGRLPDEQVFTTPPRVCIEVVSRDDTMTEMQERIDDYLAFGVPSVWLVDPRRRCVSVYTAEGSRDSKEGLLPSGIPNLDIPLADIFAPM
ncbi:MAG: Uma2 family endonuclease [Bryobacteraceae bacterium]|nr:Uma2 family endonuclease [Bryobacteraceae bacterium]